MNSEPPPEYVFVAPATPRPNTTVRPPATMVIWSAALNSTVVSAPLPRSMASVSAAVMASACAAEMAEKLYVGTWKPPELNEIATEPDNWSVSSAALHLEQIQNIDAESQPR